MGIISAKITVSEITRCKIMSENDIEKQINEKGLNAPRLRPEDIDAVIVSKTFTVLPSGKTMVCELILTNG